MAFALKQNRNVVTLILAGIIAVFSACSNRDSGISNIQIGEDNNSEAHIGSSFPVKADISLDENIQSVTMTIASTDGSNWDFTQNFTEKYAGSKTAKFQENIEVPTDAEMGNYELLLTATGESGAIEESSSTFRVAIDSTVPTVTDLEVGLNSAGDDLHLEAHLTAAKKIKQVILTVKGERWIKDVTFDKSHIKGQTHIHFHEHADIESAPAGEYSAILLVEDEDGRKSTGSAGFTKR